MIDTRASEDTGLPGFELPQYMGPRQWDWVSEQGPDMKLDTHTGVAQGPIRQLILDGSPVWQQEPNK